MDYEPDAESEPSLGWTADGVMAGFNDREAAAGPDVRAARERNHRGGENPAAISIDLSRGYIVQITGLTSGKRNCWELNGCADDQQQTTEPPVY